MSEPYVVVTYDPVTDDIDWFYVDSDGVAHYNNGCPACGQPIDYCQGHGEIGDPQGAAILAAHDEGNHMLCHPEGCEDAGTICV